MTHPVIIWDPLLCEELQGILQDPVEIGICDPAVRNRHNIIEAAALMQPQGHRAVFDLIAKGIFHFVAVAFFHRAGDNAVINSAICIPSQQTFDLAFLYF